MTNIPTYNYHTYQLDMLNMHVIIAIILAIINMLNIINRNISYITFRAMFALDVILFIVKGVILDLLSY